MRSSHCPGGRLRRSVICENSKTIRQASIAPTRWSLGGGSSGHRRMLRLNTDSRRSAARTRKRIPDDRRRVPARRKTPARRHHRNHACLAGPRAISRMLHESWAPQDPPNRQPRALESPRRPGCYHSSSWRSRDRSAAVLQDPPTTGHQPGGIPEAALIIPCADRCCTSPAPVR